MPMIVFTNFTDLLHISLNDTDSLDTIGHGEEPIDLGLLTRNQHVRSNSCVRNNWELREEGMNGCPDTGCRRANTLEAAKKLCLQDQSCNGVLRCPYNDCSTFEIRPK